MGYRPEIICGDIRFEMGKFYGYVNMEILRSIEWLKEHGKISDTDGFYYFPYGPTIEFSADEFREFMDLYEKDINNYPFGNGIKYDKPYKIAEHYPLYVEVYSSNLNKIIDWG